MHKFRCPDGHEFEAKRNFYAHCPVCGKNAKRTYEEEKPDGKNDPPTPTPTPPIDPPTEVKPPEEIKPPEETPLKQEDRPRTTVRRVKVKRGEKTKEKDGGKTKEQPSPTPAKKVRIKKGLTPKVNKKIVTTRDRKLNKEKKEERATQWRRVKSFKLF